MQNLPGSIYFVIKLSFGNVWCRKPRCYTERSICALHDKGCLKSCCCSKIRENKKKQIQLLHVYSSLTKSHDCHVTSQCMKIPVQKPTDKQQFWSCWCVFFAAKENEIVLFISSPEHKVLKVIFVMAYCPSSIVRPSDRASVRASTISLNNMSSETAYWILTKLHRNDPWVVPYQSCSNRSSWLHK